MHVEVEGLEPNRDYWYRFHAGDATSRIGRTRTLPRAKDDCRSAAVRVRVVPALRDGVLHRLPPPGRPRISTSCSTSATTSTKDRRATASRGGITGLELASLEDYRNRYAQYRLDPDLQAAHAAFPWIVTPDDHEVDNNYAGRDLGERRSARRVPDAPRRRLPGVLRAHAAAAAFDAEGPDIQLYRQFTYGKLASFFVLDTRQYRSDQPCGDGIEAAVPGRGRSTGDAARARRRRSGCSTRCRARARAGTCCRSR